MPQLIATLLQIKWHCPDYYLKNVSAQDKIERITEGAEEIMKQADAEECKIILAKATQFTDSNCPYLEYWAKEFLIKLAESRLAGIQSGMKSDSELLDS